MTGFSDLDELLGGVQPIGPGDTGRTAVGGQEHPGPETWPMNNAKSGRTCAIFSLEMTADQLAMRAWPARPASIRTGSGSALQLHPGGAHHQRHRGALGAADIHRTTPLPGDGGDPRQDQALDLDKGVDLIMVDYLQAGPRPAPRRSRPTGCRR